MSIFNPAAWFASKKLTLDDVSLDDLRREKFKYEHDIKSQEKEETRLSKDMKSREAEFCEAASTDDKIRMMSIMRNIETRKKELQTIASSIKTYNSQLQVIIGMIAIKEKEAIYKKLAGGVLGRMNIQDLQKYIQDAMVGNQFQEEQFARVIDAANAITEMDTKEDKELLEIYKKKLLGKPTSSPVSMLADDKLAELDRQIGAGMEQIRSTMRENR